MSWGARHGRWIGPVGFVSVAIAASCSDSGSGHERREQSTVDPGDGSGASGGSLPGDGAGGTLGGFDGRPIPIDEPPEPPDPGPQPFVACGDAAAENSDASPSDAGELALCELPRSRCFDEQWLVYYSGGKCIDGACRWEELLERCPTGCVNGGCSYNGTFAAPP
jgi:hypothetical protein